MKLDKFDYKLQLCIYRGFESDDLKNLTLKELKVLFDSDKRKEVLK